MPSSILKYVLRNKVQDESLPVGATILSAVEQGGVVVIYALADKEVVETDAYRFYTYGTGAEVHDEVTPDMFLGTVVLSRSSVVHVFRRQLAPEEVETIDEQTND